MKRVIKNNYKIIIGFILGLIFSITTVYAVDAYIESNKVAYTNHNKNNVEEAIDELYERSGIHKEKWVDPILNGADPVLKDPLIPVEIKPNGDVYYANENSEWYNYSEKRWANAIILIDNPSNKNYTVGDHILEKDIESYFVWIPRYQYKIWNLGNYSNIILNITNTQESVSSETALWKVSGNNTILIDIKFGTASDIPKMAEPTSTGVYYTHPAFTLGEKDLNGIWVGKFETGYKGATSSALAEVNKEEPTSVIIKPDVYSWRGNIAKNMFMTAYNYERGLDSHMLKNTEWGAAAYLSHSQYGIGNEVNINNVSNYKTGYSAAPNTIQSTKPNDTTDIIGEIDETKTQPWNSSTGYLASTTGNISGIYDMSGGAWECMAACIDGNNKYSGFDTIALADEMRKGYIDKYKTGSITSYNNRILGDATGELGSFYKYYEKNGGYYPHSSWYGDYADFIDSDYLWFNRGGIWSDGSLAGQFYFARHDGSAKDTFSFRISLALTN